MTSPVRAFRVFLVSCFAFAMACESGPSAPESTGERFTGGDPGASPTAVLAGKVTAGDDAAPVAGLLASGLRAAGEDEFIGAHPLAGAIVRLTDSVGAPLAETRTDAEGAFSAAVPGGGHMVHLELEDGSTFSFPADVPEGVRFFLHMKLDRGETGELELNAEVVRDNDGDGAADDGFAVRVRNVGANRPGSGRVSVVDPGSDSGGPAGPDDFFEGQRVRVAGAWDGSVLVASRVAGNCGANDQPRELVGAVESFDGSTLVVLGREIVVDADTRFAGTVRGAIDLQPGDRVVVRLEIEGETLVALRVTGNGRARLGDEVVGRIESIAEDGSGLVVLGVEVALADGALLTSGNGCRDGEDEELDEDEAEEEEAEDDEVEDDEAATFVDLEGGQLAVVVQGRFADGVLEADHVVASTTSTRDAVLVFGTVTSVDAAVEEVEVMDVVFGFAGDPNVVGPIRSLGDLPEGARVMLTFSGPDDPTIEQLTVIGPGGPDMIQGATIGSVDDGARTFEALGVLVHVSEGAVINVE